VASVSTGNPLLSIRNLSVRRRDADQFLLSDVSMDIAEGGIIGLVGESGSGKSTLCRAVAGLLAGNLELVAGEIHIRGVNITNWKPHDIHQLRPQGVSMVFQDPARALNPVMPVGKQLEEAIAVNSDVAPDARRERALSLLGSMGFMEPEKHLGSYPHQLSGGQRQRVVLAIALAKRPALLIADEPTSAVDVSTQSQILSLLEETVAAEKLGILLVTHDFGVVSRVADVIAVMFNGQLMEQGRADEVLRNPLHPYTRALIDCLPNLNRRVRRLPVIPTELRLRNQESCPFYARCEYGSAEFCDQTYRELLEHKQVDVQHFNACVRTDLFPELNDSNSAAPSFEV
jgi:oligopeptide/dipeptide ABC transporter ATP-binding protein